VGALVAASIITIGSVLWRRLALARVPHHRWDLGRWGPVVNILALVFLLPYFVILFFPLTAHPTAQSMNWAVVIFGGVTLLSLVYYAVYGRSRYVAPVVLVHRASGGSQ